MHTLKDKVVIHPRVKQGNVHRGFPVVVNHEKLQSLFHMRLTCAAKEMNISVTALKGICRKLGIMKWPRSELIYDQRLKNVMEFKFKNEWLQDLCEWDLGTDSFWDGANYSNAWEFEGEEGFF